MELGQQAAKEVEQQLPLLRDDGIESFVDRIGRRLVQVIPSEMEHREFRYSFKVIDVREINAFALPGGPMYINRGMIQAAGVEGEVAGVMAHELSHVILRHGTAGATKQQPFQIGAIAGAIAGAIIGGNVGQVVAQGTQFGLGTYFLRYSREYRSRPTCWVHMFQTLERNHGNRTLTAQQLKIASATLFRKLKDYAEGRWALVLLTDVARRCLELAGAL